MKSTHHLISVRRRPVRVREQMAAFDDCACVYPNGCRSLPMMFDGVFVSVYKEAGVGFLGFVQAGWGGV